MVPTDPDDDALSWDDDIRDPSYARDGADDAAGADTGASSDASAPVDTGASAQLVAYGAFAGVYLLLAVGWIIAAGRDTYTIGNLVLEVMYQLGQFLAIAAPVLWFALALLLTARRGRRFVALLVGVVVLAPWPFLLSSAGA